jgi:hypothetical protein
MRCGRAAGKVSESEGTAVQAAEQLAKQLANTAVDRNVAEERVRRLNLQVAAALQQTEAAAAERDTAVYGRSVVMGQVQQEQEKLAKIEGDYDTLLQDHRKLKRSQAILQGEVSQLKRFEKMAEELHAQALEKQLLQEKMAAMEQKLLQADNDREALRQELGDAADRHRVELERLANDGVPAISNLVGARRLVNRMFLESPPSERPSEQAHEDAAVNGSLDDFWGVPHLSATVSDMEAASLHTNLNSAGAMPLMQLAPLPGAGEAEASPREPSRSESRGTVGSRSSAGMDGGSFARESAVDAPGEDAGRVRHKDKGSQIVRQKLIRAQGEVKRLLAAKTQQSVNINQMRKRLKDSQAAITELQEHVLQRDKDTALARLAAEADVERLEARISALDAAHAELVEKNSSTVQALQERLDMECNSVKKLEKAKKKAEDKLKIGAMITPQGAGAGSGAASFAGAGGTTAWRSQWRQILQKQSESESSLDPMPVSTLLWTAAAILSDWAVDGHEGRRHYTAQAGAGYAFLKNRFIDHTILQ